MKRDEALFVQRFGFDRVMAYVVERGRVDKRIDEMSQVSTSKLSTVLLDKFERDVLFEKVG